MSAYWVLPSVASSPSNSPSEEYPSCRTSRLLPLLRLSPSPAPGAAIIYGIVRNKKERALADRANAAVDRYNEVIKLMSRLDPMSEGYDFVGLMYARDCLYNFIAELLFANSTVRRSVTEKEVVHLESAVDELVDRVNAALACGK